MSVELVSCQSSWCRVSRVGVMSVGVTVPSYRTYSGRGSREGSHSREGSQGREVREGSYTGRHSHREGGTNRSLEMISPLVPVMD